MKQTIVRLISVIVIAAFAPQGLAWVCRKTNVPSTQWNEVLRPLGAGERLRLNEQLDIEKTRHIIEELCGDEHIGRRLEAARFLKNNENHEEIKLPRRADTDTHMHSYHSDGYQTPTAF